MNNADRPINPMPHKNNDGSIQYDVYTGLTKREYFAAMAMQGILSNTLNSPKSIATDSVNYADALLSELDKPQTPSDRQPSEERGLK